jgi:hypothetical protein
MMMKKKTAFYWMSDTETADIIHQSYLHHQSFGQNRQPLSFHGSSHFFDLDSSIKLIHFMIRNQFYSSFAAVGIIAVPTS